LISGVWGKTLFWFCKRDDLILLRNNTKFSKFFSKIMWQNKQKIPSQKIKKWKWECFYHDNKNKYSRSWSPNAHPWRKDGW
jgi:hypothetical protein